MSATTSGATQQIITNAAMSNWRAAQFNATAPGNSVTYLVTNVAAGTYHLYIAANAGTNCGQFQLACGTNGGAFTDVGSVQDTYSSSNMVYLLPIRINTPTNSVLLWTNMQREFDCGNWTATNTGNYNFRLTVTGKNTGSSSYVLMPDYIKLAPPSAPAPANSAPTDISLSNTSVAENQPSGTAVGTFSSTDPDSGNTFTYSLVSGTGSTDNGSFTINGNTLQTAAVFSFDAQNSFSIRVRTTDQGGLYFERVFTITVTDQAPATPSNVSPADGMLNLAPTLTLQASAFSDPDADDAQQAAEWLVLRVADSALVFDSGADASDKTSLALPAGALEYATSYDWQVRYENSNGTWSGYSTPTAFSTAHSHADRDRAKRRLDAFLADEHDRVLPFIRNQSRPGELDPGFAAAGDGGRKLCGHQPRGRGEHLLPVEQTLTESSVESGCVRQFAQSEVEAMIFRVLGLELFAAFAYSSHRCSLFMFTFT